VYVCLRVCVCMYMYIKCIERYLQRDVRECVYACVCVCVCVYVYIYIIYRRIPGARYWRERERESECVRECVCVHIYDI